MGFGDLASGPRRNWVEVWASGDGLAPVRSTPVEIEADAFATYFLMPTKWIKKEFENRFSNEVFQINEDTAFRYGGRSVNDLRKECKAMRGLSRKLASTELYDSKNFISLAKQFNVSVEAMAIRLEELDLVKY